MTKKDPQAIYEAFMDDPKVKEIHDRHEAGFYPMLLWVPQEDCQAFEVMAAKARKDCGRPFAGEDAPKLI